MARIKVKIKDLKRNPFISKEYPINNAKVTELRRSFRRSGFWDNLLGRKNDKGEIEIAYGLHRLVALQMEYPPEYEIEIEIRKIGDDEMIRIFANSQQEWGDEDEWGKSLDLQFIKILDIKAVRDYLREHPKSAPKIGLSEQAKFKGSVEKLQVWKFLKWNKKKVIKALVDLEKFETYGKEGETPKDFQKRGEGEKTIVEATEFVRREELKEQRKVKQRLKEIDSLTIEGEYEEKENTKEGNK